MTTPALLARWYDELLAPTFLPEELPLLDEMLAGLADGSVLVHALGGQGDEPEAVAVGRFHEPSRVLLLEFLAVRPGLRGRGSGARLMAEALDVWEREVAPSMVVGEIEHPWLREADEALGDPVARLRFYERAGVRVVPVGYVLPPMRPGGPAVPHLMLGIFRVDGQPPGEQVPAAPLRSWLADRFPHAEEPYARALADVSVETLPTIGLGVEHHELPNGPRR